MRRFHNGDHFVIEGIQYDIRCGRKYPDDPGRDLVLLMNGTLVSFDHVMLMTDFFCENEDSLYPPPAKGGAKFLGAMHTAWRRGWREAVQWKDQERKNKQLQLYG
jgi:hypothetical protein